VLYVRIIGLGLHVGYCRCLRHLVVIALLNLLRGRRVGCIWGGFYVDWHACVGLWRFVGRMWCVSFVRGMLCVSSWGV